jgi:potassium-transporting ATPase KdpC subunit
MIRRQIYPAVMLTVLACVVLGIVYPVVTFGIGQLAFRRQTDGSLVTRNGVVVGSALLGQGFLDAAGRPLPQYFQPRPSAVGYDGVPSGAANLGPGDPRLVATCLRVRAPGGAPACDPETVPHLARAYRAFNGLPPGTPVPVDAVTSSGSGLDPDVSVANADLQATRVARVRHLPLATVMRLVRQYTSGRTLGFLGEVRVNVLELNLALDRLGPR